MTLLSLALFISMIHIPTIVYERKDPGVCPGATYFFSGHDKPYWAHKLQFKCKIGNLYFYGEKDNA